MATQAGKVQSIENGKFLVKDHNGNIKELKEGDIVFENDTVYGDISNSNSSKIEILLDGNDVIVLMQGQKQLIDSSLIETAFGNEELFFTREAMEQVLDAHNEIANVWSDLRDADFDDFIDITEEETTAGEEEEEVTEGSIGTFASRNGDIVDVISDLRKKSWVKTQTYKEVEKGDDYDKLNSKPLGNITPIVTIPIDRPTSTPIENVTPPTVTPIPTPVVPVIPEEPLPLVTLGVDDVTVYESEGFLIFTVTIDQPTRENISFNYKTSQNTAESGKDYHDVEGNITIPSGSTSVQIKVPVVDDYVSDNGENMKITISNPIGNVVVSKPEGVGTILDNPPANNNPLDPNKPDSETGTYGEEDTVFVVITGDKTVNEGDKANYTVQIIDKDGNPVVVTKDTKVTVIYKNISTSNDDTEYKDGDYIKKDIIIKAGTSKSEIFDVQTKDDYLADNGENFKLEITQVETTNEFENIVIGDKNGNQKDITTTILDNSNPINPGKEDGGYGQEDTVYVKLINSATVKEGVDVNANLDNSTLKHYLQLVDKDGKPVEIPSGKSITIELEYKDILGAVVEGDFKDGGDFKNKTIIAIDSNTPKDANGFYILEIKNPAIFDNSTENLEIYELTISKITQNGNPFENVAKHPTENSVTGSIYDTNPDDVKIETKEDTSNNLTISNNIKDMFVDNGKGFVKVPENGQVILYDNDKPIGTITYDKGNSQFTFKPYDDYSDYTKSGDVKFLYYAVNNDNTTEFKNVKVTVTPVADVPTVNVNNVIAYEDASNYNIKSDGNKAEGTNKIPLSLIFPSLSKDQTDKNGGAGDTPERNGEITLKFTNGLSVTGAKLFNGTIDVATINSNNQEIKVVIVKTSGGTEIDTDYHHKGTLPTKGGNVLYLTKTEYENLKIQHSEDNDTDITINIGVTSYELDDSGVPLTGNSDYLKTVYADMEVNILPVTDNISIKWDDTSKGTISNGDKTYTFTSINKAQNNTLDIKAIMSSTSGAGTDTNLDLDGSEIRTYEITGLPKGTVVTIGKDGNKQEVTVGDDGKATIEFNNTNNQDADPNFSIKLPQYYAGTVKGTITLKVVDKGVEEKGDSTKWGVEKTDSVNFKINVMPSIIDKNSSDMTIQIAQAIGNEDAGRGKNNILNSNGATVSSSGNITNPENGLTLNIEPKGSNLGVKGETATIWIDKVPVGGSLYIYDNSTKTYKLVGVEADGKIYEYSKSGTEYTTKKELTSGKTGNISITKNGDDTYKVEILDYQNSNKPKFIPPHNDDSDYIFKISGEKVSSAIIDEKIVTVKEQYNNGTPLDMSVIVKNVADEPINTELVDSGDKIVTIGGETYIKAVEDTDFYLKDIYKNGTPSSFDKDGSEVLSIKITLPNGVTMVDGKKYHIDGNEYVIKSTDLDNIKLQFGKNFSGTLGDIKLKYITTETEKENSSKTHFEQNVKLFVNPVAEAEIYKSTTGDEDSIFKVDFSIAHKDGDTNETLESIMIKASDIENKDFTLYIGNGTGTKLIDIATKEDGYYKLIQAQWENVYAKNTAEHTHGNYKFDVKYIVKDTVNGVSDTKTSNFDYEINIKAVTDQPNLDLGAITTTTDSKVTIVDKTVTIKEPSADFKVPFTTKSNDKDGSETVQEIVISGVPQGVEVVGATYYGYNGSPHNGIWVIKNPTDKALDTNGASSEITFKVHPGSNFESRDIKITTYTKDSGDAKVESASQTIRIEKGNDYTPGTGTGTPPLFNLSTQLTTIYEDNDSDPKTDGKQDEYNLGKSIVVTAENGHPDNGNYAITITDFPDGTTVTGHNYSYVEGGKTFYVVVGEGNAADAMKKLSEVIVTPPKDMNTGGVKDGKMTFSATISTFAGGVFKEGTAINSHENDITPVTDPMTVTITAGNINEDGTSIININLSNPSDGTKTVLGDTINITVVENWKDIVAGGATNGTFTVPAGYIISSTSTDSNGNTVYSIKKNDGSVFSVGDINGLTYQSANNRDGEVKFEVSVQNNETGSTVTLDSKGDKTITVAPVIDTKLDVSTVVATGTEDLAIAGLGLANPLKVTITADANGTNPLVITDKSETLGNIVLDKIPNGMTVWYMDGTTLKMATNIGTSTGSYTLNPNGDNKDVGVNKWLIPTVGSNVIPEIYVNAPENWAGTFAFDVKLSVYEQNLSTPIEKTINSTGTITPVADGLTASGTKITKNVFQWADLQLNANMKDVDGSEVMNLELSGLSANAQFKLKDGSLTKPAVWDVASSKWTISGIKVDDINKIQFMDTKSTTSVTAKAWTQELDSNGNPLNGTDEQSTETTITDLAKIDNISGNFTFGKELSLDFDKIGEIKTGETYNIGLKDITSINLGSGNGAKNELLNLTLEDVLDMGKSENGEINLTIYGGGTGSNKDKVTFKDINQWNKSEQATDGYYEYTNTTDPSVKVKVQQEIEQPIL
ncbi:Calx-beta domain-containing protein [Aliarcobacter vitoriensis]|uniref:Calx-beta domain-containing protein n=2 Tax=Aliarcobacter TaxID=2321111 RepID=UPI003AAFEEA5